MLSVAHKTVDKRNNNLILIILIILIMKTKSTVVGIKFPKTEEGKTLAVLTLMNGNDLVRQMSQFKRDIEGSSLTFSAVNAAAKEEITLVSAIDLVGAEVEFEGEFGKAGSTFVADADYIAAITDSKGVVALRKVKMEDGTVVEKEPAVGDNIVRKTSGYHPDGFVTISLAESTKLRKDAAKNVGAILAASFASTNRVNSPVVESTPEVVNF